MLNLILLIIFTFSVLGILLYISYKVLPFIIKIYENKVESIVRKILENKRFHNKKILNVIYIINIIAFLFFVFFVIYLLYNKFILYFVVISVIFLMLLIFLEEISSQLKFIMGETYAPLEFKLPKKLKENYISNRLKRSFLNTFLNFVSYFIFLSILLIILDVTELTELPYYVFYIYILMLPIALVTFVNIGNKNKTEGSFRRIIIYILLLVLILIDSYDQFIGFLEQEQLNSISEYLVAIILIIFTALDNVVQEICKDFNNYKENDIN